MFLNWLLLLLTVSACDQLGVDYKVIHYIPQVVRYNLSNQKSEYLDFKFDQSDCNYKESLTLEMNNSDKEQIEKPSWISILNDRQIVINLK